MRYQAVPASSETILRYASFLGQFLKYNSVRQYLNIIRVMHREFDLKNPLSDNHNLSMLLRGMRRQLGDTVQSKHPMTPQLLKVMLCNLDMRTALDSNVWAVALLLFFGLLRKASVLPSSNGQKELSRVLQRGDIVFYPWGMLVTIRFTKTIQFHERVLQVPIPRMPNSLLCPVQAAFHAFSWTPRTPEGLPAFMLPTAGKSRATPLLATQFLQRTQTALRVGGITDSRLTGHSYRVGGATLAYAAGLPVNTIKTLGDWKSSAYERYVHIDADVRFTAISTMQTLAS